VTSLNIAKHSYEIDLVRKRQKNISYGTEREIYTEEDLQDILKWSLFPADFEKSDQIEYLVIGTNTDEYKKIEKMFYLSIPSAKKTSVFERGRGKFKPCNSPIRITKIINPQLRSRWNLELEKALKSSNDIGLFDPTSTIRFLFYTPKNPNHLKDLPLGNPWELNSDRLDCFLFSQDVFYLSKLYQNKTNQKEHPSAFEHRDTDIPPPHEKNLKQVMLAEVIVGNEFYCSLKDLGPSMINKYNCVVSVVGNTWIWHLAESMRAYPMYIIDF